MRARKPAELRFWEKVQKGESCWLWLGATTTDGYGLFRLMPGATMKLAHRVSWFLTSGAWPIANCLHRCDTPSCVNTDHLFVGTQRDNMRDCRDKGRLNSATGDASGRRKHPLSYRPLLGSAVGGAKLTDEKVLTIRKMLQDGHPQSKVARAFDISQSTVSSIATGKIWRHVT